MILCNVMTPTSHVRHKQTISNAPSKIVLGWGTMWTQTGVFWAAAHCILKALGCSTNVSLTLPVIMGRIFSGFVLICLCFHSTRSQSSYSQGSNYGYQPNVAPRVCDHSRDCLKPNEFCVDTQQGPGCKCLNGYQWDETSRDCLCVLGKFGLICWSF